MLEGDARGRWGGALRRLMAFAPGGGFLVWFIARARVCMPGYCGFTLFDDSMISMSYARTLADSHQWAWFAGAPRVQGFTNPLWTLYMTFLHLLGLSGSAAALAVSITGAILLLSAGLLLSRIVRRLLDGRRHSNAAALVAGASVPFLYPVVFWTLRGMEVGLLAVLGLWMVDTSLTLLERPSGEAADWRNPLTGFAVAASLGVLTRLDFLLTVAVVFALVWCWLRERRARRRFALAAGASVVLTTLVVLLFQRAYFGDWLPNTYRLKMGGIPVTTRLHRGVLTAGKALPVLALVAIAVVIVLRSASGRTTKRGVILLVSIWASGVVYSLWVGGDAWEWSWMLNRYVSTGLVAAAGILVIGLVELLERSPIAGGWTVPLAGLVALSALGLGARTNPFRFDRQYTPSTMLWLFLTAIVVAVLAARSRTERRAVVAGRGALLVLAFLTIVAVGGVPGVRWFHEGGIHVRDDAKVTADSLALRRATTGQALIASVWAGTPSYYANRPLIDLLGKNDRRVAARAPQRVAGRRVEFYPGHNKWDYDYSVGELRPDVVYQTWDGLTAPALMRWGYERRCLVTGTRIWVLRATMNVDRSLLPAC